MKPGSKENNKKIRGIAINSGRVVGRVCLYSADRHKTVPEYSIRTDESIKKELERFDEVLVDCSNELDRIASDVADKVGNAEAEIFLTQKHIMNDPKVIDAIRESVGEKRKNVEWAISDVLNCYEEKFAAFDNQYLRERASDIGEIRRRLLGRLSSRQSGFVCRGQKHCARGENRIIIAEELTPDMIVNMNIDKVLGFVTARGGITSHAAIMARALGIPAVSGVHGVMGYVECGDEILVDGDFGTIYLSPDKAAIEELIPTEQVQSEEVCVLKTPEGMEVLANASSVEDVKHAISVGADGIGLFRTEIVFIREGRLLSEDEQSAYYLQTTKEAGEKPVTFRMLDAGGDKPLPFLRMRRESNPYLGWRGARFLLGNPSIFETQIRALGKVSLLQKVRILFPMVVDKAQLKLLVKNARSALSGSQSNMENIEFGAMFEVPSAFLQAEELFKHVSFGSIGSNDLIQYLFALDRGNELVAGDYDPDHAVLWDLLSNLNSIAKRMQKPLSMCGEMAGRDGIPERLLKIGITSISVSPRLVPRVRNEMARSVGISNSISH